MRTYFIIPELGNAYQAWYHEGMSKDDYNTIRDKQVLVNRALVDDQYNVGSVANMLIKVADGHQPTLNFICRATMGMGHIALSQELIVRGALPCNFSGVDDIGISLSVFQQNYYRDEKMAQIPYLLASQSRDTLALQVRTGLRKTRAQVLDYMAAHPGLWPDNPNAGANADTPLVRSETILRKSSRWSSKVTSLPAPQERHEFQTSLISHGADINGGQHGKHWLQACIPDDDADEPLDFADLDFAISLGVDLDIQGPGAWARAIRNDIPARRYNKNAGLGLRCQALVERGVELHSPNNAKESCSPLAMAIEKGHLGIVRTLIQNGVDPCWEDPKTKRNVLSSNPKATGTCLAALKLFPQGVFLPIIDNLNSYGDSALHAAVNELNAPLVQRILEEGANIDLPNAKGKKPMQAMNRSGKAAQAKFDDVVAVMMDFGADLGAEKNATAMHKAAVMLSVPVMKKLIDQGHGADLFKLDHNKRTPFEMVVRGHQHNASSQYDPVRGARQVACVKFMMEQGVDIKAPFHSGNTALHSAVGRRCNLLVEFLLEQGLDPYSTNKEGQATFQKWDRSYYKESDQKNQRYIQSMVEAFRRADVDLDLPNKEGVLPFHILREEPWFISMLQSIELTASTAPVASSTRRHRL
jgi:ankyrin repeat protein